MFDGLLRWLGSSKKDPDDEGGKNRKKGKSAVKPAGTSRGTKSPPDGKVLRGTAEIALRIATGTMVRSNPASKAPPPLPPAQAPKDSGSQGDQPKT